MDGETERTKRCPYCASEIPEEAVKCRQCGEWVERPGPGRAGQGERFSNAQEPWRLVLLSMLTFGIYEIYWFWRNWRHLVDYGGRELSPGWRTVGLFVPGLNIYLIYTQFRDIRKTADAAGCDTYTYPGLITAAYAFLSAVSFRFGIMETRLTDPAEVFILFALGVAVDLLSLWLLVIVQRTLNGYWAKTQPGLAVRKVFTRGETVIIIAGALLWVLSILGTASPR